MSDTTDLNPSENPSIPPVIDEIVHVAGQLPSLVTDALDTVAKARGGDLVGALSSGVRAAEQVVQVAKDAAPLVKEASGAINEMSHVISRLVAGGVLGIIEHEVGPMTEELKARLEAFIHGIVSAASVFAHQE